MYIFLFDENKMYLKFILVLYIFISKTHTQFPGGQIGNVVRFHRECQSRTGVSDATALGVTSGRFPNDAAFKRHLLCMNQKMGFQDNNGNINRNVISRTLRTAMPNANIEGVMRNCAIQRGSPEETAFAMDQCFFNNLRSSAGGMG